MTEIKKNPKVDLYLEKATHWKEEMTQLRELSLETGLVEELKWGKPCYTLNGKNVVLIQGFKEYMALLFLKGTLIDDGKGILIKTGENTEVGRQIRFHNLKEVTDLKSEINDYIQKAIAAEKVGLKVPKGKPTELVLPIEFQKKMNEMPELEEFFETLTPGRQKTYARYFADAKRTETREARIIKYIPKILDGKGLND